MFRVFGCPVLGLWLYLWTIFCSKHFGHGTQSHCVRMICIESCGSIPHHGTGCDQSEKKCFLSMSVRYSGIWITDISPAVAAFLTMARDATSLKKMCFKHECSIQWDLNNGHFNSRHVNNGPLLVQYSDRPLLRWLVEFCRVRTFNISTKINSFVHIPYVLSWLIILDRTCKLTGSDYIFGLDYIFQWNIQI